MPHRSPEALRAGLDDLRAAPLDGGEVRLLVRRPDQAAREVLAEVTLDVVEGVVGDNWLARGSRSTADGAADPAAQVTLMNYRAALLVAGTVDRIPLAGDQIYVDMNLGVENLPPGTLLDIGGAVLEVSAKPHTGCAKFIDRFGAEAVRFMNSPVGRRLRLRGMNARVVSSGVVRLGDVMTKHAEQRAG